MSLTQKTLQLKLEAECAARVAAFWQQQIAKHGEAKATEFYTSLGLNHLESKASVDWEGLTLSREPSEIEKLCVKGVSSAQDAGKEQVGAILMKARTELIDLAMKKIKKLAPADYHSLVIEVPDDLTFELQDQLGKVFINGKKLVARELEQQTSKSSTKQFDLTDDDEEFIEELADLSDSRMANEVQARISAAAARHRLLGLEGPDLSSAIEREVSEGSTGWVERVAIGASNRVLSFGRSREMEDRADEIERYEYSALLDANVCEPCAGDDGQTAASEDDLPDAPNPDCAGSDYCRCFHVAVVV